MRTGWLPDRSPLTILTGKWGDITVLFDGDDPAVPQPDFIDISAVVLKFKQDPAAVIKAQAQLQPNVVVPDRPIDFNMISPKPWPRSSALRTAISTEFQVRVHARRRWRAVRRRAATTSTVRPGYASVVSAPTPAEDLRRRLSDWKGVVVPTGSRLRNSSSRRCARILNSNSRPALRACRFSGQRCD